MNGMDIGSAEKEKVFLMIPKLRNQRAPFSFSERQLHFRANIMFIWRYVMSTATANRTPWAPTRQHCFVQWNIFRVFYHANAEPLTYWATYAKSVLKHPRCCLKLETVIVQNSFGDRNWVELTFRTTQGTAVTLNVTHKAKTTRVSTAKFPFGCDSLQFDIHGFKLHNSILCVT